MGLGKTLQSICLILHLKETGQLQHPVLVVAPTSLLTNWAKEAERFAPSLNVTSYYGAKRVLSVIDGYKDKGVKPGDNGEGEAGDIGGKRSKLGSPDVVLTTYATLRMDINSLQRKKFSALVIDEAQYIKDATSATAKALKLLGKSVPARLALTGTPVVAAAVAVATAVVVRLCYHSTEAGHDTHSSQAVKFNMISNRLLPFCRYTRGESPDRAARDKMTYLNLFPS